jgi:acetylornithine deacetylase/succinyl-diaminopimelate desuccinylase-like protein
MVTPRAIVLAAGVGLVASGAAFAAAPARAADAPAISAAASARCAAAVAEARAWRRAHEREILAEFATLLAIPNVANDSANIERNAAVLVPMLEKRGLKVRVLRLAGAPPMVIGDLAAGGGTAAGAKLGAPRTLAFYAHYDGQPCDTASWNGLPWTPVLRATNGHELPLAASGAVDPEARLFARSAGDDKAPIIAMLVALDALRANKRALAFNLRLVFEGEEEAGSPHMAEYLAKYPDVLRPDAWIICDGPVHQSGRMELAFGARGMISVDMTVYGPVKGLHDGHYGNWVPNPIVRLTHLIDSMRDEDGRILIAGFDDDVKPTTPAELAALHAVPDVETALKSEFAISGTEGRGRPLNETLMAPALNVRGIQSGRVGERATNTIQTEATASIDFRLVPVQTPEAVRAKVERHLAGLGYTIVDHAPDTATREAHDKLVRLVWGPGYPAARTPLDLPLSREITALLTAAGHEPVRLPTLGGSVPMYLFQRAGSGAARAASDAHGASSDTPVLILPIANHDDNQHAANENLRIGNLWDGVEVFAGVWSGAER